MAVSVMRYATVLLPRLNLALCSLLCLSIIKIVPTCMTIPVRTSPAGTDERPPRHATISWGRSRAPIISQWKDISRRCRPCPPPV
ncbi:hypothetical protein EDC04DRAFT_2622986, partial [Pisolithus marmoratus]